MTTVVFYFLVRPVESKRSAARSVSGSETQISQAQRSEICKSNYPIAKGYWELVKLKYYKCSAVIFVS